MKATDGKPPVIPAQIQPEPPPKTPSRWLRLGWVILALLPALFLGGIGGYAFSKARYSIKEEILQTLATIAEQKTREIDLWLSGIRQDAILFCDQTPLSGMVARWFHSGQKDAAVENTIRVRLGQILKNRHYSSLAVFDLQGRPVLTMGDPDAAEHSPLALEVIRHGEPKFVDLHGSVSGLIELGVLAPFISQTGQTIGALYLALDAADYLYPLLQSWPIPHATAETILVRRDGQAIEFISPLHLLNIPALTKRVPINTPHLPASAAFQGFRGIYEKGTDYRGKRILSYVAAVNGTPWVMVAKMDNNEAYARIHRLGWYFGAAFAIALFSIYWGAWLFWRNHSLKHRLLVASAQQAQRQSEVCHRDALNVELEGLVRERTAELQSVIDQLSVATKAAEIGIWDWWVQDDRLVWDDRMFALYGINAGDFCSAYEAWIHALHPDDKQRADGEIKQALSGQAEFRTEFRIIWPDKSVHHIMAFARVLRDEIGSPLRMIGVNMDVTDKIQAAQEMAEKEMRWHVALESHDMGVWDWHLDTDNVLFSTRWKTMLGYSEDGIEGNFPAWKRLIHPDDEPGVMRTLQDYFDGNQPYYRADIRLRTKEGGYRWIYTCGKVTDWSPDGKPLRMIGTHTDIDRKKRIEMENQRLASIIDASSDLILIADSTRKIAYINPAGCALLGIESNENLASLRIRDLHPRWAYEIVSGVGSSIAIDQGTWTGETALLTRDGREVPVSQMIIAKKKTDGSDEIEFFATIARDISKAKRVEASLRDSEARLDFALQNSQIGAWEMNLQDLSTHHTLIHDRIYGYETMLPCWNYAIFLEHVLPEDRAEVDRIFREAMETKAEWSFEFRIRRADGEVRWVYAAGGHLRNAEGTPGRVSGIVQDITDRKRIVDALAQAKEAAEAASRAKSAFLANMSHEIRTPLNSIIGKAQLMKTQGLDDKAKGQRLSILNAAQHLLSIVNDILDLSKIEAGKLRLEITDFPVRDKIEEVVNLLVEKADEAGVVLAVDIEPTLPPVLRGDNRRIRQLLLNLVGNAVNFTEKGTVTVRAKRMGSGDGQLLVRFEVQDTGIGISPEYQQRLFENFEQADNQSTRTYGGIGLGLAICKRLAEQMGGNIGVTSEVGVGSLFWFDIPLTEGSNAPVVSVGTLTAEGLALRLSQEYSDARVLLVEDNLTNQEIAVELLQEVGIAADLALNGEEGVDRAAGRDYDLILMDIQMPKMDGLEATRLIRCLPGRANVPIVALTANAFAEDIARYLEAGMNGHIAKPIIIKDLYQTMLNWLSAKKSVPVKGEGSAVTPSDNEAVDLMAVKQPTAFPVNLPEAGTMARLAAIPGLDPQAGLNSVAGKSASYIRLLAKFADRQKADMADLRNALAEGDLITAKRIAHTLKGLAGTLGAALLQASAQQLDAAFRESLGLEEINRLSESVIAENLALAEAILDAVHQGQH